MNTKGVLAFAVSVVILASAALAVAQVMLPIPAAAPKIVYLEQPGLPVTIVVQPTLPDKARLCAEPAKGALSCRTAAEFRAWVVQR